MAVRDTRRDVDRDPLVLGKGARWLARSSWAALFLVVGVSCLGRAAFASAHAVIKGDYRIEAGQSLVYPVPVDLSLYRGARIRGRVTARDKSSEFLELLVYSGAAMALIRRGKPASPVPAPGVGPPASVDVQIPESGTYYLIVSNSRGPADVAVQGEVDLVWSGPEPAEPMAGLKAFLGGVLAASAIGGLMWLLVDRRRARPNRV